VVDLWERKWSRSEQLARVRMYRQLAAVLSQAAGVGVYQRYRKDKLRHHVAWRQLGSGTYVVVMEPSTNLDASRFDARQRGELIHSAPGEQRKYKLGVLAGVGAVAEFAARSELLASGATA
jgi:hypothetical protein